MRSALVIGVLMAAVAAGPAAAAPARIAFTSGDQLWTMNADGSAASRLTHFGQRREALEPSWSPDGSRIAITLDQPNGTSRIWTVAANGGDAHPLTPPVPHDSYESSPAWSPDGSSIAFDRVRFNTKSLRASLLVVGADGRGERTVVSERLRPLGGF
jgi:dipeptidyl aminopeptidase/acylaminoacyl peptidase